MRNLNILWLVLGVIILAIILLGWLLKSMDRRLDDLLPSDSQKKGRGRGDTSKPKAYE